MRRNSFKFLFTLFVLAISNCPAAEPKDDKAPPSIPKTVWYSDLGQAATDAREKNAPLLLLLELPDHLTSRQLLSAFDDEAVLKQFTQFVPVRLNVHLYSHLVDKLLINTFPDLRIFTSDGRQLGQRSGRLEPDALAKFLEDTAKQKPDPNAPTLSMLFPSGELESLLTLEQRGKLPGDQAFARLMELASGKTGETRLEAQRLLRHWSRSLAPALVAELSQQSLKRRMTAFEVLKSIDAPLSTLDPWAGPAGAELIAELTAWAKKTAADPDALNAAAAPGAGKSPFNAQQLEQIDSELRVLGSGDEARAEVARQRLMAFGRPLVPVLRERARAVVTDFPAQAVRLDELRFRLLLNGDALRKQPGITMRLVAGGAGSRASELQRVLSSGASDLGDLAREAACDRDALVREMAVRNAALVMDEPDALYREALRDPDANVRTAALTAMAASGKKENAAALKEYLDSETDTDMVCHAVKALAAARTNLSKEHIRKLLKDKRWQVRATAAEQIKELGDKESVEDLVAQLENEDGFVSARIIEALAKLADSSVVTALGKAVEKNPELTVPVLKAIGKSLEMRSAPQTDSLLRKFVRHTSPQVRAEALTALSNDQERPAFDEIAQGLKDEAIEVRTAAVRGMRSLISRQTLRGYLEKGRPPQAYIDVKPNITDMLKDTNETLMLQATLTLSYFGDSEIALPTLKTLVLHPSESIRNDAFDALEFLPSDKVFELIKLRLEQKPEDISESEWSNIFYGLRVDREIKDAEWMPEPAHVDAFFALLPHVSQNMLNRWYSSLHALYADRPYQIASSLYKKANKELAKAISGRLPSLATGDHRDVAELLWIRTADIDDEKLKPYLSDKRAEFRRMAALLMIRASERGPDDLVPELIKDASAEVRLLGVAAAIPAKWRGHIDDPTAYDLIAGNQVTLYDYHTSTSSNWEAKAPPVVQLPVETLEGLLKDDNAGVRAITAFLMAMEGGDHGIDVLVKHWRSKSHSYDRRRAGNSLVGAVVLAWNDSLTSVIEQVYEELSRSGDQYEIGQMYNLIAPLQGDQIKKLRARIRRDFPGTR